MLILILLLAGFGALMYFAPQLCVRADKRDDPEAIAQIKKAAPIFLGFAVMALIFWMKYR